MAVDFALQFKRQYADSLDQDFRMSTAQRLAYLTSPLRYAGQPVFDTEENKPYYLSNTLDSWVAYGDDILGIGDTVSNPVELLYILTDESLDTLTNLNVFLTVDDMVDIASIPHTAGYVGKKLYIKNGNDFYKLEKLGFGQNYEDLLSIDGEIDFSNSLFYQEWHKEKPNLLYVVDIPNSPDYNPVSTYYSDNQNLVYIKLPINYDPSFYGKEVYTPYKGSYSTLYIETGEDYGFTRQYAQDLYQNGVLDPSLHSLNNFAHIARTNGADYAVEEIALKKVLKIKEEGLFTKDPYNNFLTIVDNKIIQTPFVIPDIDVTYAQLRELINNNELITGRSYKIIDFQTVHIIPNSNHLNVQGTVYTSPFSWTKNLSEGVEPIVVTPTSNSTLSPLAFSTLYPTDIIYYDVKNDRTESLNIARKGWITRRIFHSQNLDFACDFRNVRLIRYEIKPDIFVEGNAYARNKVIEHNNGVYVSLVDNNTEIPTHHPYGNGNGVTNWVLLYHFEPFNTYNHLGRYVGTTTTNFTIAGKVVPVQASNYKHYPIVCYNTSTTTADAVFDINPAFVYDITVKPTQNGSVPNILLFSGRYSSSSGRVTYTNQLLFEANCNNITIACWANRTTFDRSCSDMLIFVSNDTTFGMSCTRLLITRLSDNPTIQNKFEMFCSDIIFHGGDRNFFGAFNTGHIFKARCNQNQFTRRCVSNTFHNACVNNSIPMRLYNSTFKAQCLESHFGAYVENVIFNNQVERASINVSFTNRTITTSLIDTSLNLKSSTGKVFKTTVDDSGVVTNTELT